MALLSVYRQFIVIFLYCHSIKGKNPMCKRIVVSLGTASQWQVSKGLWVYAMFMLTFTPSLFSSATAMAQLHLCHCNSSMPWRPMLLYRSQSHLRVRGGGRRESGSSENNGTKSWLTLQEHQEHHIYLGNRGKRGTTNPSPVLGSFSKCHFFFLFLLLAWSVLSMCDVPAPPSVSCNFLYYIIVKGTGH